jgi:hypothetical protein
MTNRHSVTLESLDALASGDKDRLRAVVFAYIHQRREVGATDDETSQALGLVHNSVAPRRTELEDAGLVVKLFSDDGQRVRRKTRAGCNAGVYVAAEFALSRQDHSEPRPFPEFGDLKPTVRWPD